MAPVLPPAIASGLMMPSVRVAATSPPLLPAECAQSLLEQRDHIHRAPHDVDTRPLEGSELFFGGSGRAGNDCAGVPHPTPLGRGLPGNEADHRLREMFLNEACRALFISAPDLSNHDDRVSGRIVLEGSEAIDEISTDNGIASNPHTGTLADAV